MRNVALLITLGLHAVGIWDYTPSTWRDHLIAAGSETSLGVSTPLATSPLNATSYPVQFGAEPLQLSTSSALAVDAATGTVLYSHNPNVRRPIASITKLVTSMVILSRHKPTDILQIPELPVYQVADERIGLQVGESYTVSDLLHATLINSGNDAADALAIADAGSIAKFANRMNAKMAEWGIEDTHFVGPSGLQDTNNYASAAALIKISRLALTNSFLKDTVNRPNATITSTSGRVIELATTNQLLATGQFYGIKTGYTPAAGECFVGLTRVNGHEVITVVLDASNRFGETQRLTNWLGRNWQWL